jgi:hypothetical protein
MLEGVKNSAGIEENTGTRFGGLGDSTVAANTSRIVSRDGWTTSYEVTRSVPLAHSRIGQGNKTYLWRHTWRVQLSEL